jgi:hypothetical protein
VSPCTSGSCSNVQEKMNFLYINLTRDSSPYKKILKTRKLKSIHEQHFVERKNKVKNQPANKNSSKRRLSLCPETSTKNAICGQYSTVPKVLEEVNTNIFSLHIPHIQFKMRRADYTFETRLKANTISRHSLWLGERILGHNTQNSVLEFLNKVSDFSFLAGMSL